MYQRSSLKPYTLSASDFEADRTKAEGMFLGLRFSRQYPKILATATTDGGVVLWQCYRNDDKAEIIFQEQICDRIWSFCWDGAGRALFVSDLDSGAIYSIENGRKEELIRKTHDSPVHSLEYWEKERLLITVGYDQTVLFWDLRQPQKPVANLRTKSSGSASLGTNMLVVIQEQNQFLNIYDLKDFSYQRRPEYVRFPARTNGQIVKSAVNKKDSQVAVISVAGEVQTFRVQLSSSARSSDYYEKEKSDSGFYYEEVHAKETRDNKELYQVNDVLMHPDKDYFTISGASDGNICVSNTSSKKTHKTFNFSDTWPIVSLAINEPCELMAIALGNDYHLGWEGRDKFSPACVILKKINEATFSTNSYGYKTSSYGSLSTKYGGYRGLYS